MTEQDDDSLEEAIQWLGRRVFPTSFNDVAREHIVTDPHCVFILEKVRWVVNAEDSIRTNNVGLIDVLKNCSPLDASRIQQKIENVNQEMRETCDSLQDEIDNYLKKQLVNIISAFDNKGEAQAQRDHEVQMALIQRDTAIAQAEAARLTAEATTKAQEQASKSLDGLINGIKGDE